jgi:hypothetical protein
VATVYKCVKVDDHEKIAKVTLDYAAMGWSLHSYQTATSIMMNQIYHFLLFSREREVDIIDK